MEISSQPGCICGITSKVEKIESLTRDLQKFFDVDEIVYYGIHNLANKISIIEVEPGYKGDIDELPPRRSSCDTYPVIKGLGMRWETLKINKSE